MVCPWCYVGARRFAAAARKFGPALGLQFEIRWRPYQLNPTQKDAVKLDMYNSKFGAARVAQMLPQMAAVGAQCDPPIKFSYGGMIGNTLDAHRLLELAWRQGGAALQNAVQERLFRAYFEEEQSVGDHAVLVRCAAEAGMDEAAVRAFLATPQLADEVKAEIREFATSNRISGVPVFILDGKLKLSGAQDVEVFGDAFQELAAAR